jgi:hypothetical protein
MQKCKKYAKNMQKCKYAKMQKCKNAKMQKICKSDSNEYWGDGVNVSIVFAIPFGIAKKAVVGITQTRSE